MVRQDPESRSQHVSHWRAVRSTKLKKFRVQGGCQHWLFPSRSCSRATSVTTVDSQASPPHRRISAMSGLLQALKAPPGGLGMQPSGKVLAQHV